MSGAYLPVTRGVRDRVNAYLAGMAARGFVPRPVEEVIRSAPVPSCCVCMGYGVVSRSTPAPWATLYRGEPLKGRYLDPCPAVGCEARVREFGS